jgi:hypothetical protein
MRTGRSVCGIWAKKEAECVRRLIVATPSMRLEEPTDWSTHDLALDEAVPVVSRSRQAGRERQ